MPACRNCNEPLGEATPNYCPNCGQETALKPPTLGEFAQQFGGSYLAMEGALWRTLRMLLLRPGMLTLEYFAGRRRRYVLPLRLYLTVSLLALLALRLVGAVQVNELDRSGLEVRKDGKTSFTVIDAGGMRAGVDQGVFFCKGMPVALCHRLQDRFDLEPKMLAREVRQLPDRMIGHWGAAMFLLLPGFAMGLKLTYLNRHMRYAEHLVFALHLHAFWFLALLGLALTQGVLGAVVILVIPAYTLWAMQRVYGGRWWATALRAAAQATLYGVTILIAVVFVSIWAVLG